MRTVYQKLEELRFRLMEAAVEFRNGRKSIELLSQDVRHVNRELTLSSSPACIDDSRDFTGVRPGDQILRDTLEEASWLRGELGALVEAVNNLGIALIQENNKQQGAVTSEDSDDQRG
jgi:hypothetical protein